MIMYCLPSYNISEQYYCLTLCVIVDITHIYNESILYICCVVKPTKTINRDIQKWVWEL